MSRDAGPKLEILTLEEAHRRDIANDPLGRYFSFWDDIEATDVTRLGRALDRAKVERDMQEFLERHPKMLIQHLGGGHGRWVIPQARLGSQYVPDFIIGDEDSTGRSWVAVELESPRKPMFNKSGDPSSFLWHAIRQIIDWRVWLDANRDYARRPPEAEGLGLVDISTRIPGLVIIGRRNELNDKRAGFRKGLMSQLDIEIHSYDWLVDRAAGRVASLGRG